MQHNECTAILVDIGQAVTSQLVITSLNPEQKYTRSKTLTNMSPRLPSGHPPLSPRSLYGGFRAQTVPTQLSLLMRSAPAMSRVDTGLMLLPDVNTNNLKTIKINRSKTMLKEKTGMNRIALSTDSNFLPPVQQQSIPSSSSSSLPSPSASRHPAIPSLMKLLSQQTCPTFRPAAISTLPSIPAPPQVNKRNVTDTSKPTLSFNAAVRITSMAAAFRKKKSLAVKKWMYLV